MLGDDLQAGDVREVARIVGHERPAIGPSAGSDPRIVARDCLSLTLRTDLTPVKADLLRRRDDLVPPFEDVFELRQLRRPPVGAVGAS